MAREQDEGRETSIPCAAEEFCDARVTEREETMRIIEGLIRQFLEDIANGRAPELYLVGLAGAHTLTLQLCVQKYRISTYIQASKNEKNVLRDEQGRVHLGQDKTVKSLFSRNGAGCRSFVKSKHYRYIVQLAIQFNVLCICLQMYD